MNELLYPDETCDYCWWDPLEDGWKFTEETDITVISSDYSYALKRFAYCTTFQENLAQVRLDPKYVYNDPCLAYNSLSSTQVNCALCKIGSIRIAVTTGSGLKYFVCGSVRKPDRNGDGSWQFLNPDDA